MNRLANEPSPYLQQHADNPVDWWPWCDEAFEEARQRDVPVFLSIGYATCHWCHVMAHESFENEAIAAKLNEAFVCIKVDREQRPDIDDAYMAVCQAMNGSGGWPLNLVLDHDRQAWFAGTYFPPTTRGRIGMDELVPRLQQAWRDQREELQGQARHILDHLAESAIDGDVDAMILDAAEAQLARQFDDEYGGFGRAPKFPSPHQLRFLLRHYRRTQDSRTLHLVTKTLDAMAMGGLHDHVAGGFHRYSTDAKWLVPHFEKMLYDQAGLLDAYVEAWQVTGATQYEYVARRIIGYLQREMRSPSGSFYSAQDADSEGEEGRFATWPYDELVGLVGAGFVRRYRAEPAGNFDEEATGQPTGRNILHRQEPPGPDPDLDQLLARRQERVAPLLDDKILTDWNGLLIGALARAGRAFRDDDILALAVGAAEGLLPRIEGMHVQHMSHGDHVETEGFLDDHAFLAGGLLALFEATQDPRWLAHAKNIVDGMADFRHAEGGFQTARGGVVLNRRPRYDGALPSGNAAAVEALWRLGRITGEPGYDEEAWTTVRAFGQEITRSPSAFTAMLAPLDGMIHGGQELVLAGDDGSLQEGAAGFQPHLVTLVAGDDLAALAPWTSDHRAVDGQPTAYLCVDHACRRPTTDPAALAAALNH